MSKGGVPMMDESTPSEKDVLDERIAGLLNNIWDWLENNPIIGILLLCGIGVIVLVLLLSGVLKKIGPLDFSGGNTKPESSQKQKLGRQITDLPAPAPTDKTAGLPARLRRIKKNLSVGKRTRILIQCDNRSYAEELGKRLYYKLEEEKIGNHIGWVSYRNLGTDSDVIDACIDRDFSIFNDNPDFMMRKSRRLDLLRNAKVHTILFINLLEQPARKDYALERYNNLPGLSVILISDRKINGYETYPFTEDGGEL